MPPPRNPLVLDTMIASDWWVGRLSPSSLKRITGHTPILTVITHAEMLAGAHKAEWAPPRMGQLQQFLQHLQILHINYPVVQEWARLSGKCERGGQKLPANDCWIAACCIVNKYPLYTRDEVFMRLVPFGLRLV